MTAVKLLPASAKPSILLMSSLLILAAAPFVAAGTFVRVGTGMGPYYVELLDDVAPATVQNFLNYVDRGDFDGTYIHRLERNFVVQGGGYRFQSFVGPIDVPADPPIVNEFNVSNTRGTLAMAKLDGDPDSATNEWFVNLSDNSANLDAQNGGFTVFGNVLGEGMDVLDAINGLPTIELGTRAPSAPYVTDNFASPTEFVYINAAVVDRPSASLHTYENQSGLLFVSASINNGEEFLGVIMQLVQSEPQIVFEVKPYSVISLQDGAEGVAEFATSDSRLRIPALETNFNGTISVINNVVMLLTDPENLHFTLESYEQ
ncbi:MAG: peptidylprolyl isomerase [Pseudohongiellaceae bacterium]